MTTTFEAVSGPLRVAAVIDGRDVTGPLRQLAAIIHPLGAADIDLRPVVFLRGDAESGPHIEFLRARGIEPTVLRDRGAFDPTPVRQFRHLVREWEPHVVQTHGYRPTVLAWLAQLGGRDWRWIGWHHGVTAENLSVRAYHNVDRWLLPSADRLVVVAATQVGRYPRARGRIDVIHNASIDLEGDPRSSGTTPMHPGWSALAPPRVAVVGRLSREKGVDIMLHALALMHKDGVHVSLVVAGDGPDRPALERLASTLGLDDTVAFLGYVDDVARVYQNVDAVVLPSRSEGLPNALLEALRANKPVVATSVGAVPEVLTNRQAGLLVPPENPRALADALGLALTTPRSPEADTARARALLRFTVATRVERHVTLYQSAMQSTSARTPRRWRSE